MRVLNRVYEVKHKDGSVYYMIGAKSRTDAIQYFMGEDRGEYIDYRAKLATTLEGKPIETETNGFMEMKELMSKGFKTWWACDNCGRDDCFDYEHLDNYKCRECGHIDKISFGEE